MILTEQQRKELLEAARPLIQWMNENTHPHCIAHVTANTVEVFKGVAVERTDEFLKD